MSLNIFLWSCPCESTCFISVTQNCHIVLVNLLHVPQILEWYSLCPRCNTESEWYQIHENIIKKASSRYNLSGSNTGKSQHMFYSFCFLIFVLIWDAGQQGQSVIQAVLLNVTHSRSCFMFLIQLAWGTLLSPFHNTAFMLSLQARLHHYCLTTR